MRRGSIAEAGVPVKLPLDESSILLYNNELYLFVIFALAFTEGARYHRGLTARAATRMLKLLRRHLKLVLWFLVASFVLWEIGSVLASRQAGSLYAGTLFGRAVTIQDYKAALDATQHRARLTYGEQSSQLLPRPELERQAWDRLMLLAAARRARIRVTDQEIIAELQRWPLFQKEGRFDLRTYEMVVHYALGTTPRAFEEEVRGQLAILKLLEHAAPGAKVSEEELLAAYRAEAAQARIAYCLVDDSAKAQQLAHAHDPLAVAAKALGLSVTTTDWVTRASSLGEAGSAGALLGPAFDLEVGQMGKPWQTSHGWIVAQLLERRPIDPAAFAKARDRLQGQLLERKRLAALNGWMRQLRDDAKPRPDPQFSTSASR